MNLTLGTLAALIKYPSIYGSSDQGGFKKYGIFQSEAQIAQEVWQHTGLAPGTRHPLAYVMEACDDIAYSVIDAEDTVKKGYASFYDLMDFLQSSGGRDETIGNVVEFSQAKNKRFKLEQLSSRELNDMSMQMFRVKAIHEMVQAATVTFVDNIGKIMAGDIEPGFELIKRSACAQLCKAAKEFARRHGFQHRDVLRLELEGNRYIKMMMNTLWRAIQRGDDPNSPFERFVFGEISENYRRVYSAAGDSAYARCQLLCDVLSGMTESYLVQKHAEFSSLANAAT